ncbi:xanthine dehydrogenase family protein subunit M [Labrenzia sp. 011]|uniref:FAD binding domain-containing protein n=1 Tax=Labrenzia sp. 011 TaxID=2171494 RepID=UPI000D50939F|nr:xanthine dehydrogenase family protein subunit M [Labrenzia sp. 011]PVB59666.1 carbon monoxide dehydrogenase [Labrenzia sp. 011]
MKAFSLQKPASVADAVAALGSAEDVLPLAGGMTLIPTLKQRLSECAALVDLSDVPELRGISLEGDVLVIGAMTRHTEVANSDVVRKAIPSLAALASRIGDQQVRNRGTIGGSVANNDPAADYPAAVLVLNAEIVTNVRTIPADAFFIGMFETALEPGEIILRFRFPVPDMAGYAKFASPASRYALAGVFVARTGDSVRAVVTGAASSVFRATDVENALARDFQPGALDRISIDPSEFLSDIHADKDYRGHLAIVMAKRAVQTALALAE